MAVIDGTAGNDNGVDNPVLVGTGDGDTINGLGGNDIVEGFGGNDTINGGEGNDLALLGGSGDDIVNGDAGNDVLFGDGGETYQGPSGSDDLFGGDGDDLMRTSAGLDSYDGGDGSDRVSFFTRAATQAAVASLLTQTITNDGFGNAESMTSIENLGSGTAFADTLEGDNNNNYMGAAVGDFITGLGGNDLFQLGGVPASLDGGDGNDTITIFIGTDMIADGADVDTLADVITATNGVDVDLRFNMVNDDGYGNSAAIISIENVGGSDLDDTISGSHAVNLLWGWEGEDFLRGFGGNDIIEGNEGDDLLRGDGSGGYLGPTGDDTLSGGDGNDVMWGGGGDDNYDGGAGTDRVSFYDQAATTGAIASILTQTISNDGFGNTESMVGIEDLGGGTAYADNFEGDNNNNFIGGGAGDTLSGLDGDDSFQLDSAPATIDGGDGNDTIGGLDGSFGALTPDTNSDGLAETIFADHGVDIDLGAGAINDDGFGNSGTLISIENAGGSALNDTIDGSSVANNLWGFDGNDSLFGLEGDDVIEGGEGNDDIYGDLGVAIFDVTGGADTLDGGEGNDVLRGAAGDDTYIGGNGTDRVSFYFWSATQAAVVDLSTQTISNDGFGNAETMSSIEDIGAGTAFADTFTGSSGANFIIGGLGDTIDAGAGDDFINLLGAAATLNGGDGIDWLDGFQTRYLQQDNGDPDSLAQEINGFTSAGIIVNLSLADNQIVDDGFGNSGDLISIENVFGSIGNDVITGDGGANDLEGSSGNDTLNGGDGDDYLEADAGTDTLNGGDGYDLVYFNKALANQGIHVDLLNQVVVNNGRGSGDTLISIEYFAGYFGASANTTFADTFIGDDNANTFTGGSGDTMVGNAGADTITAEGLGGGSIDGGTGIDLAVFSNVKYDNAGTQTASATVGTNVNLQTGAVSNDGFGGSGTITGIENVETGGLNDTITGNASANALTGGGGNDTMTGGGGADALNGGAGNDTYTIDAADTLTDSAGVDTVRVSFNYTLLAGFENLTITTTANVNGSGNASANTLTGGSGNNILDGKGGVDIMIGGLGNDTYVVNTAGETVTEGTNAGTDLVQSAVTYTLGANVENLTLTGVNSINGTGNALNNIITGNSEFNTLNGLGGNDTLFGGNSADTLNGGEGNDTLDGGGSIGHDTMVGGNGDDTYIVDHASDGVSEASTNGVDIIFASVSRTLEANVENLTLTGTNIINGTGNTLANVITGNSSRNVLLGGGGGDTLNGGGGDDTLNGEAGIDTMSGGAGNDDYIVDNSADVIVEAAGQGATDEVDSTATYTLSANVENLRLLGGLAISGTGNASANIILGNDNNNVLNGGAGNDALEGAGGADTLNGGAGFDNLIGGNGNDVFVFNAAAIAANADYVENFRVPDDTIHLENAIFTALGAGPLAAAAFWTNTTGNAHDASDRIIYNTTDDRLYYDPDGTGGAAKVLIATISSTQVLTVNDFVVI